MEKVVRDGKVAVLISPGFGAGWSTWSGKEESQILLFEPDVVAWVEGGKKGEFPNLKEKYPGGDFYHGGVDELEIVWVPVGTKFRINEYDGSESIVVESDDYWIIA